MSDLHKAAQQALWALQYHVEMTWPIDRTSEAIFNLRAALAEPESCPNCASLEAQNTELDRKLAEMERAEPKGGGRLPPPLQAEPDLSRCPQCNGPADNGHDRSIPPSPYLCTKCMAEMPQPSYNATVVDDAHPNGIPLEQWQNKPVQEPDHTYKLIGCVQHDCEECQRRTQRKPLTEKEVYKMYNALWRSTEAVEFARAVERAHGIVACGDSKEQL